MERLRGGNKLRAAFDAAADDDELCARFCFV